MTDMDEVENIPAELKQRDQWLMWDAAHDTPRRPHWKGDFGISWSDPDDWHSFEAAVGAAKTRDSWGIGYVMAKDNDDYARGLYGCLDLDGVYDAEAESKKEWLPGLSTFFDGDGYLEYSPSGTGIHIPLVGQDAPDWWSDSHFTADEHEGVEYLTNKFVTFTGDKLRGASDTVSDADPTPFLRECYEILNDDPGVEQTSLDESGADDDIDRELSRAEIETALEHIDANCGYNEWRDILYAIHDWDDGQTGKSLAEQWSRGPGWDDDAQEHLDNIWTDAEQGTGITVGTLIHKARSSGWDGLQPTEASTDGGAVTTQNPGQSTQGPSGPDVDTDTDTDTAALTPTNLRREAGIGDDESVDELTDRQKAAFIWELIKRNDRVHIRIVENDDIYAYDSDTGVWNSDNGDRELKQAAREALPTGCYGSNVYEQLRSQVEADPHATMYRDDFGLPPGKIAVENGIVDLQKAYQHLTGSGSGDGDGVDVTDALRDLEPTDYALRRLNCSFDPTADGSEFRSFVGEVVENTMIETTQEYLGTCLYRGHLAEKALMLVGGGANGKSTFLNIIKTCLGKDNISSVTPGDYRNKNAIAKLDSKVANISAEVSGQTLQAESLNKFKNLTGDDDVMVEEKYQTPYQLNYTGGMIFATNEVPDSSHVSDDDFAFWRRWLIVQFPNEFPEGSDKRDPNIADRLQQDEHQSAVLNWMIEGLGRFRGNGDQFDNAPSTEETQRTWETWGDSLEYFLNNVAERDESADNISTGEAYAVYKQWCREQGESSVSRHKFTREAKSRDFGYGGGGSTKIRTERESTPVRGYTCFGTSDAQPDPVEIVTDETDVTDETAAVASGSIESYGDTDGDDDGDDDDDVDVSGTDGSAAETESDDHDPGPDQDGQDESVDSDSGQNGTNSDLATTETESSADPDPDPDDQDQDQDQDRYEAGDVDAPDSKYQRRGKLKGKLRAADTDEFLTAADLVAAFGWPRETIDATIEELRRDDVIFGSEKTGWRYDG